MDLLCRVLLRRRRRRGCPLLEALLNRRRATHLLHGLAGRGHAELGGVRGLLRAAHLADLVADGLQLAGAKARLAHDPSSILVAGPLSIVVALARALVKWSRCAELVRDFRGDDA